MRLSRLVHAFGAALPLFLVACGASGKVDDGNTADAGSTPMDAGAPDAGTLTPNHESYIPENQHPTAAARLIVMGDSISAGVGAGRQGLSYFNLLAKNDAAWSSEGETSLSAYFGGEVPVVNVAVSGATTASALNQRAALTTQLPGPVSGHSITVITIGGNDMKNLILGGNVNNAVNNAVSNVRTLMDYLLDSTRFPDGNSVYLAAVYDPSDASGMLPASCFGQALTNHDLVDGVENLKDRYVQLGVEMGFSVVDALGHFHGHGVIATQTSDPYYNAENPVTWFYGDCIHPNDAGHNELRRLFFEAISNHTYIANDF